MNDLDLMTKFRDEVAPPDPVALARARAGMWRAEPPRRSRWVWRLAPAGALVAALAVAGVALRPTGEAGPPAAGGPVGTAAAPTEATRVLRLAAAEARRTPALPARPDQFVYVRSRAAWASLAFTEDSERYIPPVELDRRIWLSVDGSQTGLLRQVKVKPGTDENPDLDNEPLDGMGPGYAAGLPTDAKAMRAFLYADLNPPKPGGNSPDAQAWTKVGDTLRERYVAPDSVAALFDAAATIPGTTVIRKTELAGRSGTAVVRVEHGLREELVFDAKTYRYLGEREVVVDNPAYPKGAVSGLAAQMEVAIVDKAGQLP